MVSVKINLLTCRFVENNESSEKSQVIYKILLLDKNLIISFFFNLNILRSFFKKNQILPNLWKVNKKMILFFIYLFI